MFCAFGDHRHVSEIEERSENDLEKNILDTLSDMGLLPIDFRRSLSQDDWRAIINTHLDSDSTSIFNPEIEDLIIRGKLDPQRILEEYQLKQQAEQKNRQDQAHQDTIDTVSEQDPVSQISQEQLGSWCIEGYLFSDDQLENFMSSSLPKQEIDFEQFLGFKRPHDEDLDYDLLLLTISTQEESRLEEFTPVVQKMDCDSPKEPSKTQLRCNCVKVKCLRMYCKCFAAGVQCGPWCSCVDCQNNSKNPETELSRLRHRLKTARDPRGETCHCTMSFCSNNHCPCFKSGRGCGDKCRCYKCKLKKSTKQL